MHEVFFLSNALLIDYLTNASIELGIQGYVRVNHHNKLPVLSMFCYQFFQMLTEAWRFDVRRVLSGRMDNATLDGEESYSYMNNEDPGLGMKYAHIIDTNPHFLLPILESVFARVQNKHASMIPTWGCS